MKPEWKAKWVEALRSGRYEQVDGNLRAGQSYCVIGVLCDVVDPDGWEFGGGKYRHHGHYTRLSDEVAEISGLSLEDAYMPSKLNDTGMDFEGIAYWIEWNL